MKPLSTRVTSPRVLRSRYDLYEITSVNGANNVVSGISPGQYGPSASVAPVIGPVSANVGTDIVTSQAVCNDRVAPGAATLSGCVATCGTVAINSVNVGGVGTSDGIGAVCAGGATRCGSGGAIAGGG